MPRIAERKCGYLTASENFAGGLTVDVTMSMAAGASPAGSYLDLQLPPLMVV